MVITSIKQISRNPCGPGKWIGKTKSGDSNKIQNWICSYVAVVVKRKWNWMDPATHEIAIRFWLTKGKGPVLSRMPSSRIWEQLAELEKILQKDNRKQLKPLRISGISNKDMLLVGLETVWTKFSGAEPKLNRVKISETSRRKNILYNGQVGVAWEAVVQRRETLDIVVVAKYNVKLWDYYYYYGKQSEWSSGEHQSNDKSFLIKQRNSPISQYFMVRTKEKVLEQWNG